MRIQRGEHVAQQDVEESAVMPEGSVIPSSHAYPRQVLVALQLVGDEFTKVGFTSRLPTEIRVCEESLFPGERHGVMKLVDKL